MYDLIVVGAGPVGLYATFMAGYLKMRTLCLESSEIVGGQPMRLYPKKYVYDFPGFTEINGFELTKRLEAQVARYPNLCEIKTGTILAEFRTLPDGTLELVDQEGNIYHTRFLLFTTGAGSFEPKKLEFPASHGHKSVEYTIGDDEKYANKHVVVMGGGDAACDYAAHLAKLGTAQVSLVHRGEEIKSRTYSIQDLESMGVNVYLETKLVEWAPDVCRLEQRNQIFDFPYDLMLVQYGLNMLGTNVGNWSQFERLGNRFVVNEDYETNVKNCFAAGACVAKPNRINMIISGMSEATIALQKMKALIPQSERVI